MNPSQVATVVAIPPASSGHPEPLLLPGLPADRPVPRQLVEDDLDAASRAPSSTNTQPWKVYVLRARAGRGWWRRSAPP
jgi:hypothetical protein